MTTTRFRSAEDLCIEQLADDLAAAREECDSYRLLGQIAIGQIAELTKERDRIRARYLIMLNEHREKREHGTSGTFGFVPSEASEQSTDLHT
jgi:hypothetical protein